LTVSINDARGRAVVGIYKICVGVNGIIRTFRIAITKRCLKGCKRRYAATIAFELAFTLVVGCFYCSFNFLDGLRVGLRDNERSIVDVTLYLE
jgi:hypothetical protein